MFAVGGVAALLCVGIAVVAGVVAGGALDVVAGGNALVGAAALLDGTAEFGRELGCLVALLDGTPDLTACVGACATAIFTPSGATLPELWLVLELHADNPTNALTATAPPNTRRE